MLAQRERTNRWIEEIEAKRDPPPAISREKVEELSSAYAAWSREANDLTHKTGPKRGLRIITREDAEKELALPSYSRVCELFGRLAEAEKEALLALGWFEKEPVPAHWARIYERATSMLSALPDHYQIHMGRHWLGGLERWERKPQPFKPGRLRGH